MRTGRGIAGRARAVTALVAAPLALALSPVAKAQKIPKEPNGIHFYIETSQGIRGDVIYVKRAQGTRNFVGIEVDFVVTCYVRADESEPLQPLTRRLDISVEGRARGNSFSGVLSAPLSSPTDYDTQTATIQFSPPGRRRGLPRWRKATGTVSFARLHDDSPAGYEKCDSGPITFFTRKSRPGRFIPASQII